MSFPSKSLTNTKMAEVLNGNNPGERDSLGMVQLRGKGKEGRHHDDENQNINGSVEDEEGEVAAEMQKWTEDGEQRGSRSDVKENGDNVKETRDGIAISDGVVAIALERNEDKDVEAVQAGGDGKNCRHKPEKTRSKGKHQDESCVDFSFASREMSRVSEVEVMRDVPHFDEGDFQDDELDAALGSLRQFLGQTGKDAVRQGFGSEGAEKQGMEPNGKEKEGNSGENNHNVLEEDLGGEVVLDKDEQFLEGKLEMMKRRTEEEDRETSSSGGNGDTLEEIEEELRALSKELQVAKQKREPPDENCLSELKISKGKDTPRLAGSRYGSEIEDDDEEEEEEEFNDLSLELEDDAKTDTSIQSFSKLCKVSA